MSPGASGPTHSKTVSADTPSTAKSALDRRDRAAGPKGVASAADHENRPRALVCRGRLAQHVAPRPVGLAAVEDDLEHGGHRGEEHRRRDHDGIGRVELRVHVVHPVALDAGARSASRRCTRGTVGHPPQRPPALSATPPAASTPATSASSSRSLLPWRRGLPAMHRTRGVRPAGVPGRRRLTALPRREARARPRRRARRTRAAPRRGPQPGAQP